MPSMKSAIPAPVRARLLSLGVPASQHGAEALARMFPREFNICETGMSERETAEVLIYLFDRNVIAVPGRARTTVKRVAPGWHFCQFYRDFTQLIDLVAPFIAEGLRNGEGCFWVLPQPISPSAARNALARHVDDVNERLGSGQLELMSHDAWYLDSFGRLKSFERIADGLLAKQDAVIDRGFKFLRAAGDAGWVSGSQESKSFIDYELKVNAALGGTKVAAICTYRASVTADEVLSIVGAHQDALCQAS